MFRRVSRFVSSHRWSPSVAILALSGALFTLSALHNGWMNEYYSAAALAGADNVRALFFASFDAAQFISIDKPPLTHWLTSLSVVLFGAAPLAVAFPHIVTGMLTTWLIYLATRQAVGERVALIAVGLFLLTPITSIMFGYNNPDSLLTLFMTASLYTFLRYLGTEQRKWAIGTAVLLSLGFMTKSVQVLPLLLVYGVVLIVTYRKRTFTKIRIKTFLLSAVIFIGMSLWWPLIVSITPAEDRPYIGSTSDNSPWSLIIGYNGIGRLTEPSQTETQATSSGVQFGGQPGVLRLYNEEFGPNIAWLLIFCIPATIGLIRRIHKKAERQLVGISLLWVGAYAVLFSSVQGIIHGYYALILAPPLAILTAVTLSWIIEWYRQRRKALHIVLPVTLAAIAFSSAYLLHYDQTAVTPFALLLACGGIVSSAVLILFRHTPFEARVLWAISLAVVSIGPLSYTLFALSHVHQGPFPSAKYAPAPPTLITEPAIRFLEEQPERQWIAATESTSLAAPLQLATGQPVMAIGGYNGTDPAITVDGLRQAVRTGSARYFVLPAGPSLFSGNESILEKVKQQPIVYADTTVRVYDMRDL
jgi:4-amino-4-deoxy-L-arabinose transferase-like glycosyltransferase